MISSLPTVAVTARLFNQDGTPVGKASVSMRLTTAERYGGYVVPREVVAETDASGKVVLRVWPNALGSESSEYRVHIRVLEGGGSCAAQNVRSIAGFAVVPNADCDLQDIMELAPYEQRGAGQVITQEVAMYAAQASGARDEAKSLVQAAQAVEQRLLMAANGADASKLAAQAAADEAAAKSSEASSLVDRAEEAVHSFESTVVDRVENVASALTNTATRAVAEEREVSLGAINTRSGEAITEITTAVAGQKSDAINSIFRARDAAESRISATGQEALADLREEGGLFVADMEELTELSESFAKKAGCAAVNAGNSAAAACQCAASAEGAAQGLERHRDDALAAAERAEKSEEGVQKNAKKAEDASGLAVASRDAAAESAAEAQANAESCARDSSVALESAEAAGLAKDGAEAARAYVAVVAENVQQAVREVATDLLVPDVVTEAVQRATQEARDKAAEAARSFAEAGDAATGAQRAMQEAAEKAESSRASEEKAAEYASKLKDECTVQMAVGSMGQEFITLSDRMTQMEIARALRGGIPVSSAPMPPEGVEIGHGVTVAPVTIVRNGGAAPTKAAFTVAVESI